MLKGKKVVILCGHHGYGTGALKNGLDEFTENAWCSCALMVRLANAGYDVEILTTQNVNEHGVKDMSRRQKEMENSGADIFISMHHNSYEDPQAHGSEVLYFGDDSLAIEIGKRMEFELGLRWRGVKRIPGLAVLKKANEMGVPAALIEGGFLSNESDALHIGHVSWPDRVAKAVCDGIEEWYKKNAPA